ncbi:diacylglycerol kinase accessory domain (presumed) domain-containing protein [Toxoplasma gondii GT1]|uniref:Diacylglycerol kinase n=14 Tax=Toxoplasma gondii TaxID=5811 RepID=S7UUK3_TOXGG|nr:diacylglycerol kinase accessory domain (presumed) domain-containing protein [Toxoplasma gondii GT1]KAF4642927.1 diacylglycerol kinase accessory domain (presumed) domain-containing protein [Toxoplasma gondii]
MAETRFPGENPSPPVREVGSASSLAAPAESAPSIGAGNLAPPSAVLAAVSGAGDHSPSAEPGATACTPACAPPSCSPVSGISESASSFSAAVSAPADAGGASRISVLTAEHLGRGEREKGLSGSLQKGQQAGVSRTSGVGFLEGSSPAPRPAGFNFPSRGSAQFARNVLKAFDNDREETHANEAELELMRYLKEGGKRAKVLFIFINPTSGGNKAAAFTESGVCRLTMTSPFPCNIYIFDIREGISGNKPGFRLLRAATEVAFSRESSLEAGASPASVSSASLHAEAGAGSKAEAGKADPDGVPTAGEDQRKRGAGERGEREEKGDREREEKGEIQDDNVIRVLVAGGDGTVMWCAAEADAHRIDPMKIAFGVIPYGTGNDFANAFGWKEWRGLRPFDGAMKTMRRLLSRWSQARVVHHDLWSVKVVLKDDGEFTKINSETRKKQVLQDSTGRRVQKMTFVMSNYFSMGVESRIGRGFDRHRRQSQLLNKMTYGIEGVKKAWFKRTLTIDNIVDGLLESPGEPDERVVFRTKDSTLPDGPILKKSVSLIALNIPSFSAGNDIWATSHSVGILTKSTSLNRELRTIVQEKQLTGDRELEFLSFPSVTSMGVEFACHGRARRINQGRGPWKILFKDLSAHAKVYFQVDGEFFQMARPDFVTIEHNRTVQVLAAPCDKHLHA